MDKHQDFSSSFVNKGGIAAFFVLALISNYFGNGPLSVLLLFMSVLCLVSYLWGKHALSHVQVGIRGENHYAFPGEEFEVEFLVDNDKLLPLIWLEVMIRCGENPCIQPKEDFLCQMHVEQGTNEGYPVWRRKFTWILWHQQLKWHTSFVAARRGVYFLERVSVVSGDGFGLCIRTQRQELSDPPMFVVYPKVVPLKESWFQRSLYQAAAGGKGIYQDRTLLKSSRPYQYGDRMKDINWRLMARQGQMQTNQFETIKPHAAFLILDFQSYQQSTKDEKTDQLVYSADEEGLEEMLSIAASAVVCMEQLGMACGMLLPGTASERERIFLPVAAQGQRQILLSALAGVKYQGEKTVFNGSELANYREEVGQIYLLTRSPHSLACRGLLQRLEGVPVTLVAQNKEGSERQQWPVITFDQLKREGGMTHG